MYILAGKSQTTNEVHIKKTTWSAVISTILNITFEIWRNPSSVLYILQEQCKGFRKLIDSLKYFREDSYFNFVDILFQIFGSAIMGKIFETKSNLYVKQGTTGRVQFLFFTSFLVVLKKNSFLGGRLSTRL